jgi:hypothetical protein
VEGSLDDPSSYCHSHHYPIGVTGGGLQVPSSASGFG